MSEKKKDRYSGRETTGHEWNGITELDTPVPKVVWFFLIITTLCAVIMWILLPTWPTWSGYSKGLLRADERVTLKENLSAASLKKEAWMKKIDSINFSDFDQNKEMESLIMRNGKRLFDDNCSMCHGTDATGGNGYPNLVDSQWIWGGDPESIMTTIEFGVNAIHNETRYSEMMAFGRDGILSVDERRNVIYFVQSLSETVNSASVNKVNLDAGAIIYKENCAACHGETGKGISDLGAPNLTDPFWLYGHDYNSLSSVIRDGRQGVMPAWSNRLNFTERKILTLYLLNLREVK